MSLACHQLTVMIKFGFWILNIGFDLCFQLFKREKKIGQIFLGTNKKFDLINYQRNTNKKRNKKDWNKNKAKQIFKIQNVIMVNSADEMPKLLNMVVISKIILYNQNLYSIS